jgi:hypothetical protein
VRVKVSPGRSRSVPEASHRHGTFALFQQGALLAQQPRVVGVARRAAHRHGVARHGGTEGIETGQAQPQALAPGQQDQPGGPHPKAPAGDLGGQLAEVQLSQLRALEAIQQEVVAAAALQLQELDFHAVLWR